RFSRRWGFRRGPRFGTCWGGRSRSATEKCCRCCETLKSKESGSMPRFEAVLMVARSNPLSLWERVRVRAQRFLHFTFRNAPPSPRPSPRGRGRVAAWPIAAILSLLLTATVAVAQVPNEKAFPPHRVIGNVYYVGSKDLACYLVTTQQGHILINTGFEETVPLIKASVEQLGFKMTDIKIILASHAH